MPKTDESTRTLRLRTRGGLVLVVRDDRAAALESLAPLRDRYMVREVNDGFQVLDWLTREGQLVCVICIAGGSVGAADFFRLVSRVSIDRARRVVFITAADDPDLAFLQAQRCHWLAKPVQRDELLALVAAVSA